MPLLLFQHVEFERFASNRFPGFALPQTGYREVAGDIGLMLGTQGSRRHSDWVPLSDKK